MIMIIMVNHDSHYITIYDHGVYTIKKEFILKMMMTNIAGGGGASTPSRSHTRWSRSAEGPGALPGKLVLCFSTV